MRTKHIVLISDDNYIIPTQVCVQSIINNFRDEQEQLIVHVCTFGLNENNTKKLTGLSTNKVHVIIDTYNLCDYKDRIDQISQRSHVTPTALIKFELPNYFKDIDTILYLDGDIIVKGGIPELLNIDLANNYLAASFEFWAYITAVKYSLKRKIPFYFNSGVMLMNLKQMRVDGIPEKLWYYKLNSTKTKLMDQESLNAVCGENTLPLGLKWNFNPVFYTDFYVRFINKAYNSKYCSISDMMEDVKIIHYVGKSDKPWIYKDARLRSFWDEAYNQIENREQLMFRTDTYQTQNKFQAVINKVKSHGVGGTLLYALFLIRQKLYLKR